MSSGGGGSNNNRPSHDWHGEQTLLDENDKRAEVLASKISVLRGHARDIDAEVTRSNTVLDGMGSDFGSAQGLLDNTLGRVRGFAGKAGSDRKLMCYIVGGAVFCFILVYYVGFSLVKKRG